MAVMAVHPPRSRSPAVDIVIVTCDEDVDVIKPTSAGAVTVRGRTRIYLGKEPAEKISDYCSRSAL
jgi:hypothetical protein